jgi:hypothetical protein
MFAQNWPEMPLAFVSYGLPRVGNPGFANYISSLQQVSIARIIHYHDVVPILPGKFLGYMHPIGEVHITSDSGTDGTWIVCLGEDDGTDSQCEDQTVPEIFYGSVADHSGPYNGIYIGSDYCT